MAIDLFLGMFIGGLLSFVVCLFIVGVIWFVRVLIDREMKYLIPIVNYTGGKPTVEFHKAKKITDPKLRECYFIPALKKQKRQYLPFLSSQYEYPTSKGGKFFVNYVSYNNEATPINFDPLTTEEREVIVSWDDLNDAEKKTVSQSDIKVDKKNQFVRIRRTVKVAVMRPVNKSIRKWVIDNDRQVNLENPQNSTWWENNKKEVLQFAFLFIIGGTCLFLIIFSYQHADKVLESAANAPAWAQGLVNSIQQNVTIPKLG